ncbi:hypothetical protein [Phytomonospora endophytica]|uniref:YbaB/EbfC family DNA-binding protein n=1 Tax=Phytomonospora endophytica TaxID=714109 RepID=A0A841FGK5_9ACTN|nr:hypothetical protein [Phytomonospora endophytica]MBB6032978.1 hypothetical protein [Phytomonospora endophytica]GIG65204.1 hypothetical protein Pen01_14990 [Phytomonospora endophytica]
MEQRPFEMPELPEDQDDRLRLAREMLDSLPPDPAHEETRRILDAMPTSAELAAMERERELLGAAVAGLEEARYEGKDKDGLVRVVMDYSGDPAELEFTVGAARAGTRGLAEAIVKAWDAAETSRSDGMVEYAEAVADAERRLRGQR